MKKTEFYDLVKSSVEFLTGLSREAWYNDGGAIVLQTSNKLVSLTCNRNVVTLYTKLNGEKGETDTEDYNGYYIYNMPTLTAEKIDKFLTI